MIKRGLALGLMLGALTLTACGPGVAGLSGSAGREAQESAPAAAELTGVPKQVPGQPGGQATPATRIGHDGESLPRCTGWMWEGNKSESGDTSLDVALVVSPNQPVFPALACWAAEGVEIPTPSVRVLQSDGLPVHGSQPEHHKQVGDRHLWVFSIDAPPYSGFYYLQFRAGDEFLMDVPFEVGSNQELG